MMIITIMIMIIIIIIIIIIDLTISGNEMKCGNVSYLNLLM